MILEIPGVNLLETPGYSVVIYTHPDCDMSDKIRNDYIRDDVSFLEIDVSKSEEGLRALESFTGGEHIAPVILEGKKVTIGYGGVG